MSLQTPRVLPEHLHAFLAPTGATTRTTHAVRLLGTITSLRGDKATITCGNHGDVTLVLNPDSHLQMGRLVEVVGKVVQVEGQVRGYFKAIQRSFSFFYLNFYCYCSLLYSFLGRITAGLYLSDL